MNHSKFSQRIFPIDALPRALGEVVLNVHGQVGVPVDMVVSSMLGAMSLASQELADVRRPNGMEGPVGLYLLTIAESGERKTTCDNLFTKAIQKKEKELADKAAEDISSFQTKHRTWSLIAQAFEKEMKQKAKEIVRNA